MTLDLKELIKKHQATTVFIDDLDSMLGENFQLANKERNELIRSLKILTTEFEVRLILNVTVSKKVEYRGGEKIPDLRDFTWSRSLVNAADQVFIFYRPFYYGITQDEFGNSTSELIQLQCLKNLNGIEELINLDNKTEKILPVY